MGKVALKEEAAALPAVQQSEPTPILSMLQRIMTDPEVSIERVNQAFDFYQRVEAVESKKSFDAAMSDAKAEFEPIVKRHLVSYGEGKGKTNYKHEDLADIEAMVVPVLSRHGLSHRYRASSNPNEPIRITCIITHRKGYAEETTLSAGADASGGKNGIQAIGSTATYLQRYTLKLALGLSAGRDTDATDAAAATTGKIGTEDVENLRSLIMETQTSLGVFYPMFEIECLEDMPQSKLSTAVNMLEIKKKAKRKP